MDKGGLLSLLWLHLLVLSSSPFQSPPCFYHFEFPGLSGLSTVSLRLSQWSSVLRDMVLSTCTLLGGISNSFPDVLSGLLTQSLPMYWGASLLVEKATYISRNCKRKRLYSCCCGLWFSQCTMLNEWRTDLMPCNHWQGGIFKSLQWSREVLTSQVNLLVCARCCLDSWETFK